MRHEEIEVEIPAFVRGELGDERAGLVEKHLAGCSECRATVDAWQKMIGATGGQVERLFEPHPPSVELRRLAREGGSIDSGPLGEHIDTCPRCALEVSVWKSGVDAMLSKRSGGWWLRRGHLAAAAAGIAAGIVLGVVLHALIPERPAPSGPLRIVEVAAPTRTTHAPVTKIPAGEAWVDLVFSLDLGEETLDEEQVGFSLLDSSDGEAWSTTVPAGQVRKILEPGLILSIPLPSGRLTPGEYKLQVRSTGEGGSTLLLDAPIEIGD